MLRGVMLYIPATMESDNFYTRYSPILGLPQHIKNGAPTHCRRTETRH